jgi:hypothetical protein
MNGGAGTCSLRGFRILIGSLDSDALKIPTRKAEFSLTENVLSPFQAEPTQKPLRVCGSKGRRLQGLDSEGWGFNCRSADFTLTKQA